MIHLLPNLLHPEQDPLLVLPKEIPQIVENLSYLVVESEKEGRNYLFRFLEKEKAKQIPLWVLNEHTSPKELKELVEKVVQNKKIGGIISDTGLPSISDPASRLVFELRKKKFPIQIHAGPSAPIYALMLSGFKGESFTYHGYLPRKEEELIAQLKLLEKQAYQEKKVQIWIDAPYRTSKMVMISSKALRPNTWFCVAVDLCSKEEKVIVDKVYNWNKSSLEFEKAPAVFLLQPG